MTSVLISQLNEMVKLPKSKQSRSKMHLVVEALIKNAMDGDNAAIFAIFDRIDGKVAQQIVGPDNGPVKVQFTTAEEVRVFLIERGIDIARLPAPNLQIEHRDG
jgi:uncharacterized protein (UPF0262 family)